ncbi:hypothetical protein QBC41DRAFT_322645 [Cercophora samala]|uniref:Uncharacterized protein n=1 Tax=Cercophora samala TaxID=330535 RepID=A0AA40D9G9_9PEZI|nr:hypothetical protein QBC41DRAFT_322645 [Cercophora samala]
MMLKLTSPLPFPRGQRWKTPQLAPKQPRISGGPPVCGFSLPKFGVGVGFACRCTWTLHLCCTQVPDQTRSGSVWRWVLSIASWPMPRWMSIVPWRSIPPCPLFSDPSYLLLYVHTPLPAKTPSAPPVRKAWANCRCETVGDGFPNRQLPRQLPKPLGVSVVRGSTIGIIIIISNKCWLSNPTPTRSLSCHCLGSTLGFWVMVPW